MKKLNIKDFKDRINSEDFDSIRNEILEKTMSLIDELFELKGIDVVDYRSERAHV